MTKWKIGVITSEQVGAGHPDKVCDQVADLIVNFLINKDSEARVAIEATIGTNTSGKTKMFITGEITTKIKNVSKIILPKIKELLSTIDQDYKKISIEWHVGNQSVEINNKVDYKDQDYGAGDQGLMFGYATKETKSRLPIPYDLATFLMRKYDKELANGKGSKGFKRDAKSQVSFDYDNWVFQNINFSYQHTYELAKSRQIIKAKILSWIKEYVKTNNLGVNSIKNIEDKLTLNVAGSFHKGGALADAGTVGRKIIADTYGGLGRHGGGAFSGKDYTKVDRTAAYFCRYIARKIVDLNLAEICEVQVSFIIGQKQPISINVNSFETGDDKKINEFISKIDFSVTNMVKELKMKKLDYTKTTLFGHFGKNDLPWK